MAIDKRAPFPVMELMTVKTVRAYLAEKKSVILPVGGIEQHGYHLPLRTDAVIAERLAWRAGGRLGLLVAPTVLTTFSGGGLPGTINVTPLGHVARHQRHPGLARRPGFPEYLPFPGSRRKREPPGPE